MSEEWTTVKGKKGRRTKTSALDDDVDQLVAWAGAFKRFDNDATVTSLKEELDRCTADLVKAGRMAEIKKLIHHLSVKDKPPITKAVCMGIGNLVTNNMEHRLNCLRQLVVFLDIVRHLEQCFGHKIKMYVQEPRLFDMDKAFLVSLGLEVIVWPHGLRTKGSQTLLGPAEEHLGKQTFVADFFVEWSATCTFVKHEIGLLISAWPGASSITMTPVPDERTEKMFKYIKDHFKCYKLPWGDYQGDGLHGLYLCAWSSHDEDD